MNFQVVAHKYFEYAMLTLILISSIELCFDDDTVLKGSTKGNVLYGFDIFFTISFGIEVNDTIIVEVPPVISLFNNWVHENILGYYNFDFDFLKLLNTANILQAVLKIFVLGFAFNGKQSYMRSGWNILDIFIVGVNICVLVLESNLNPNNIIWLRAFRAMRYKVKLVPLLLLTDQLGFNILFSSSSHFPSLLIHPFPTRDLTLPVPSPYRALRPLRFASQLEGIRSVAKFMALAIPATSEVFLVATLLFYIFSVLGVDLMSGLFFGCYSGSTLLNPYYLVAEDESINQTW